MRVTYEGRLAGDIQLPEPTISDGRRVPGTTLGDSVRYHAQPFSVTLAGSYTLDVDRTSQPSRDTVMYLYDGFDPANPLRGGLFYNDDSAPDDLTSSLTVQLKPVTVYTLVLSSHTLPEEGRVSVSIDGPGTICLGEDPCFDARIVAGDLTDGRVNNSTARDVGAPVAIYASESTIDVWAIDPKTQQGHLVMTAPPGPATPPAQNQELARTTHPFFADPRRGLMILSRLASGEYQLNAYEQTGKAYIVGWQPDGSGLFHMVGEAGREKKVLTPPDQRASR